MAELAGFLTGTPERVDTLSARAQPMLVCARSVCGADDL